MNLEKLIFIPIQRINYENDIIICIFIDERAMSNPPAGIYIPRIETSVDTFDTHKVVLK